jgi:hypothetical protein
VPPGKAVTIAVSHNLPIVGDTVTVQRLAPDASKCEIANPQGGTQTLSFDAQGKASWRPAHYGPHRLRCGDRTRQVWVLAGPMWFHWWDGRNFPQERKELPVPGGAVSLRLRAPEGMVNLYTDPVKLPR